MIQSIPTATTSTGKSEVYAFQNVSKNTFAPPPNLTAVELISQCEMLMVSHKSSFAFPNYPEAKKQFNVIYFSLTAEFEDLKGLFFGLTSIGQPAGIILEHQKELGTFSLKFYSNQSHEAAGYIDRIIKLVKEEIRFKKILKRILFNQREFESGEQLLRKELFS
jgi:hypothetical protein